MKKYIAIIITVIMLMASNLWALTPGSCVESVASYTGGGIIVKFACTGSPDDGAIPTQTFSTAAMAIIQGTHYLYQVKAYRTAGGTAPDAADVTVSMDGIDLLGGKGASLIPATATGNDVFPYSLFMSSYRFPRITNTITFAVANQATVSANYTLEFDFER